MDVMTGAIMSIVSMFLIFISFLILRFTIRFTIEEDYKEIGIMKAIGLKNRGIQKIYMVKYFGLSLVGGGVGYVLSIPFSRYLMDNISKNIILTANFLNYLISALSVIFIIAVTISFCKFCTGRINKMSAIDAIRQGSTGERFSVSRKIKLHNMKTISTPLYMAVSDLVSGFRKFVILMITFILGTVIIIVPINAINTIDSDEILTLFGQGNTDFNLSPESQGVSYMKSGLEKFFADIKAIESRMNEKGFNVHIHPEIMLMTKIYADDPDDSKNILSLQSYNYSTDNYVYLKGTAPKLENEIAITEKMAQYYGIGLGDTLNSIDKNGNEEFIVTALYQSMNNLGFSVRFSEKHEINTEEANSFQMFGDFKDKVGNKTEKIYKIKTEFPELNIKSGKEYVDTLMGNVTSQFEILKNIILIVVLGINFLITSLLVRMLITKEIPEIAVLKSIGFNTGEIRKWQAWRIMIVLIVSIILGTLIANLTGAFLVSGIFNFMGGTQIHLNIEPLQVYLVYPVVILMVTMASVLISLGQIRKTNIWEINNQE
jgi:putative ABC transport system permease protein